MNERIKQLALQAGLRFTQLMSNPMVPVVDGKETDLEKFAKLIVQEFVEVVKQSDSECNDEWDYAERDLCGIIKEHFGVEQ